MPVPAVQDAARESWASVGAEELAFRLRAQTDCGHPESETTSGLVAYLDGEPVGWCASSRAPPTRACCSRPACPGGPSRGQDRRQRLGRDLLRHPHGLPPPRDQPCARARRGGLRTRAGARAIEGYPMITQPGQEVSLGELQVGSRASSPPPGSPRSAGRPSAGS